MKYFIVAGEKSGDLHGGNLIKAIQKQDADASFQFLGGDEMKKASGGVEPIHHITDMAIFGFIEVIKQYPKIKGFLENCKKQILAFKPDAVILIDYAGFNMKIARFAKENGIQVHYYISPKVWAWRQNRALNIKKHVDYLYCILPFEVGFFQKFDYKVDYIGNPLLDEIAVFNKNENFLEDNQLVQKPIIALLPGSRRQEIENILSLMGEVERQFPQYEFVIAGIGSFKEEFYRSFLPKESKIRIVFDQTYDVLSVAESAIVTSGTATLETALFDVPQVVVYRAGALAFFIMKSLVKVPYISLANLIAEQEVAIELIQKDFTVERLSKEVKLINKGGERRVLANTGNQVIHSKIGEVGASERTAKMIVERVRNEV
jgi:lipid-A-disaccharide synthase